MADYVELLWSRMDVCTCIVSGFLFFLIKGMLDTFSARDTHDGVRISFVCVQVCLTLQKDDMREKHCIYSLLLII